jgi:hypothetical protein
MKKILSIAAAAILFITTSSFASEPNEKVLAAFEKTFQHVKDVNWQDVDGKFEANFSQNNIINRVLYDQDGNVVKSIRYYGATHLPIMIQAKINKKFEGKTIYGVTEVNSDSELSYHIVLEDATTWTHVQSDVYGNLTIDKKLKKA